MSKKTLRIDGYIGQSDGLSALFGDEGFSLKSLNTFLDNLEKDVTDIHIEINSGGGSVSEGFAIHDKLVSSGYNIHTEVLGLCGSIATIIALAAPYENRSMHQNSDYFIHNPYWQPMGPDAMESEDLMSLGKELKAKEDQIATFYSKKLGKDIDEVRNDMKGSKSFSAKEAKKYGLVSKILSEDVKACKYRLVAYINPNEMNKPVEIKDQETQNLFQKINAKLEKLLNNKPNIKNEVYTLEDGTVFAELPDDVELEGAPVDWEDGTYTLDDGKVVTVADGFVTSVEDAPSDEEVMVNKAEYEALIAERDQLKADFDNQAEEIATIKAEQDATTEEIKALKADIDKFRNMTVTKSPVTKKNQDFKGTPSTASGTEAKWQELINYRKSKAEAQN